MGARAKAGWTGAASLQGTEGVALLALPGTRNNSRGCPEMQERGETEPSTFLEELEVLGAVESEAELSQG